MGGATCLLATAATIWCAKCRPARGSSTGWQARARATSAAMGAQPRRRTSTARTAWPWTGSATQAALSDPEGLAVDGRGNLFIADSGNNRVREVLAGTGVMTTVAGTGTGGFGGDGGAATQAALNGPRGLTVDAGGNLFVADTSNNRVREVLAGTGVITTVAGSGTSGFRRD